MDAANSIGCSLKGQRFYPKDWIDNITTLSEDTFSLYGTWSKTQDTLHFSFHSLITSDTIFYFQSPPSFSQLTISIPNNATVAVLEAPSRRIQQYILGEHASLQHISQAQDSNLQFTLQTGSQLNHWTHGVYSTNCKENVSIRLLGLHSHADWRECFLCKNNVHAETCIKIEHEAPYTYSNCCVRSILDDMSQFKFQGDITVQTAASHSQTTQNNLNYLLSPQAHVLSSPRLQIYNKHVVATHGCATQPIDLTTLFYLQTRGLTHTQAQKLFLVGFLRETYLHLPQWTDSMDILLEQNLNDD
ncbi:MAG: SufD family Fe-S cluster assembly protein [Puniceicoccales bacterium]|jgi:Fe-S cluster assembly scaffold protein SufB|nr:SufD family Fe-S cluster assembly protein [Puniceicoccales bacterium]